MTAGCPDAEKPHLASKTDVSPAVPARRGKQSPARPRWVTAFGIAVVVLIVLFVALHLSGIVPMHISR